MLPQNTELVQRRQALRLLLIEHDASFAEKLVAMLARPDGTGERVAVVGSLAEALTQMQQEEFGVILLEFFMPDGAGLANIEILQQAAPNTPVIVIGTVEDEAIGVEAGQAGARDYLVKGPLNAHSLRRSIRYTIERHEAEAALKAQEEKYHGIFDHLMEGIFQTSPDGRYLIANQALARIYGYASPEQLMSSITDIGERLYVQPGRRAEFRRLMEENDTITDFESQIFRKDGSIIWISENCRSIRDAHGRLLHYEGTVEDITARREAQAGVQASEALYHSLVETMPQFVFRKDLQGRFTFANQQYCDHYRAKLEDILGKSDFDFFPVDLAKKYQADDQRVMATGQTLEIVEEHQPFGQERGFVKVVKTPLYGPGGGVIGLQGIFWDITAEKLAEERVRQAQESVRASEALYHSLVDTMPQCIFRKNLAGQYTFVNREFCRFVGHAPEAVLGRTIFDFLPAEAAQQRTDDDQKVITSRQPFTQIETSRFANAAIQFIHVLKFPIFDAAGQVIGLQGMFWDITDIKLAEQRLQAARDEVAASEARLLEKNVQMEHDLAMAGEVQRAMLPQHYPVLPRGVSPEDSAFRFTHRYLPSGTVGGDFFSVTAISDLEVAVFVCDVAGHGVRSALVTTMVRALVEDLRELAPDPGAFMSELNAKLYAILNPGGSTVLTTGFYLVANAVTGQVRYVNAGHPKPLLVRRRVNTLEEVKNHHSTGRSQPVLGLFERHEYTASELKCGCDDLLLLFTDGLFEVHGPNESLYTRAQLADAVQARMNQPAAALCDALIAEVREFGQGGEFEDDVCVVAMEFNPTAPAKSG